MADVDVYKCIAKKNEDGVVTFEIEPYGNSTVIKRAIEKEIVNSHTKTDGSAQTANTTKTEEKKGTNKTADENADKKQFFIQCIGNSIYDMKIDPKHLKKRDREWKTWERNEFLSSLFKKETEKEDECGENPLFNYDVEYDKPFMTIKRAIEIALETKFKENRSDE